MRKLDFCWTWSTIFAKKWAKFGQILEKNAHFCLLNDPKFLNAEINAVKSRYNTKLTVVQLNLDLSSPPSDTQGHVVF